MDLIPLQSAFITTDPHNPQDSWKVIDARGRGNQLLAELAGNLSDKEAMSYLHFARPFELAALNIGIHFGKGQYKNIADKQIDFLTKKIQFLEEQNIKLSEKLEKFIITRGQKLNGG